MTTVLTAFAIAPFSHHHLQLDEMISTLRERLTARQKEAADLKGKHNLGNQ
jgi:hypothetical protein